MREIDGEIVKKVDWERKIWWEKEGEKEEKEREKKREENLFAVI